MKRLPAWLALVAIAGVATWLVTHGTLDGRDPASAQYSCDPAYPDFCIPPPPPDLDCTSPEIMGRKNFTALPPDPHAFDRDSDRIACDDDLPAPTGTATPPAPATATRTSTSTPTAAGTPASFPNRAYAPLVTKEEFGPLARCVVAGVIDGDTIQVESCADTGTVRLILVDTPEVFFGGECFGQEASAYTRAHLSIGETVILERDVRNTDDFGRLLRYIWADGELFNERIVRDGFATLAVFPPDVKYQSRIADAEGEARAANRGLWAACAGGG